MTQTIDKQAMNFVRIHLGRGAFHPFTGQDFPAWHAWVHLLQLYGRNPSGAAIAALRTVIALVQPQELVLMPFVQAIPAVLDWGYVSQIWPQVCDGLPDLPPEAWGYAAVERNGETREVIRHWGAGGL